MKKNMKSLLVLAFALNALLSCKKKDEAAPNTYTCTTCKTTPDAVAANDASNKGVYKGTISGSTGTIMFNIQNNGTTITATMVLNGVTTTLTSTVAITNGQSYVAPFTGTLNGQPVSITFSVGSTGQSPTVTSSNIPGHSNVVFNIVKETSTNLIECFEGTYTTTKPEAGTLNVVMARSAKIWGGVSKNTATGQSTNLSGTIAADGSLMQNTSSSSRKIGTLSADNASGTFTDSDNKTVNFSMKRTL